MARHTIAVLGATGHVGKVLAAGLADTCELSLYARRPAAAEEFIGTAGLDHAAAYDIEEFGSAVHDAVVNCLGMGDPAQVRNDPVRVYEVTAYADGILMEYLRAHPQSRAVNISSGAAYCSDFNAPASDDTPCALVSASIRPDQHYGLAKLASEARHRAAADLAIIDVRLFSLFSRHGDLDSAYFMNDLVRCVSKDEVLSTGSDDFTRDYIAPADLSALVLGCIAGKPRNEALDTYSAAPVGKFEVLEAFAERFGLRYTIAEGTATSGTGAKPAYYSVSRRASTVGYSPTKSSIQALVEEAEYILRSER